MSQASAVSAPRAPGPGARGFKAEMDGLRERMRGLGFSYDEVAIEVLRRASAEHRDQHGQPITRDVLRARLGAFDPAASGLLRQAPVRRGLPGGRRTPHDLRRPRQQRAGGWRQVPPLVFRPWDSATRNAAVAVVNSGDIAPPAPPTPQGDVPGNAFLGNLICLPECPAGGRAVANLPITQRPALGVTKTGESAGLTGPCGRRLPLLSTRPRLALITQAETDRHHDDACAHNRNTEDSGPGRPKRDLPCGVHPPADGEQAADKKDRATVREPEV